MRLHSPILTAIFGCIVLGSCSSSKDVASENPTSAGGSSAPSQSQIGGAGAAAAVGGKSGGSGGAGSGSTSTSSGASGSKASAPTGGGGESGKAGAAGGAGAGEAAGEGGSAGEAAAAGSSGAVGGDFEQCVAALKKPCQYDEKEVACGSLITTSIPLTDGSTYGMKEIQSGPYGAYVEWNQGADFANPVSSSESTCSFLAATFGEPQSVTDDVLDLRGAELSLYTVFRPACMKDGEKYPVITWGNGTCGQTGGYAALLATLASHGFVVFASNSRFTDGGNNEMLKALDFAKSLNEKSDSIYYQRLDLDKIGAMGHSQGASATQHAATDPRIKAIILWNGPTTGDKPFLAVSGDRDITAATPMSMDTAIQGAAQPGAWLYYHQVLETGGSVTGHLTLMEQPDRVTEPTIAWWKYILNGDEEAKKTFVGDGCGLCNMKDAFEYGSHNLP